MGGVLGASVLQGAVLEPSVAETIRGGAFAVSVGNSIGAAYERQMQNEVINIPVWGRKESGKESKQRKG